MELEFLDSFLDDLYSVQLYQLQKDRMTWILSRPRDLNLILIILLCKHVGIHLGPAIWRAKSAPYIYIWVIVNCRLLMTENLRRQGIVIPDWCSMCVSDRGGN